MNLFRYMVKFLANPKARLGYLSVFGFYNRLSDEKFVRKEWNLNMRTDLNLESPESFNEKLQWLKIHDHKPEYTLMVDKYAVKKYIAKRIGEQYVIPTLGMWEEFKDIDFDKLPNQFVLKCTHDSGGIVICRDKNLLDKRVAKKKLTKCLKRKYYYSHREWPYKNVPPRIIAEQYMQDGDSLTLTDYKFYCFNGIPLYLYVSVGLEDHKTAQIGFVNIDWTFAKFGRTDFRPLEKLPPKPTKLDEMIKVAQKLSVGIPFLRVDLYQINGKIYFGELTFTPCAGMMPFDPPEADFEVGKLLDISQLTG